MLGCYCGLTLLLNVCSCFHSFHIGCKKLHIVTWTRTLWMGEYICIYIVYLYLHICLIYNIYIYFIYIYIYIYIKKPNFIVCDCCEHQKSTYFFIQIYFGTVFLRQCMCVRERYILKIKYLLQIYNKRIVKTNQGNNMKT